MDYTQRPKNDVRRQLSPSVRNVFESTPENEAMFTGRVPEVTYGTLASRMVEAEVVEPTLDAVCDFLFINRAEWKDFSGELAMGPLQSPDDLLYTLVRYRGSTYARESRPALLAAEYAAYELRKAWQVDPQGPETVEAKSAYEAAHNYAWDIYGDDPKRVHHTELDEIIADSEDLRLHLAYQARRSGYAVSFADFKKAVTEEDATSGTFLGHAEAALKNIRESIDFDHGQNSTELITDAELMLSKQDIAMLPREITAHVERAARARAIAETELFAKLIMPADYKDLELFQPLTQTNND